jgi:hypothetical protein
LRYEATRFVREAQLTWLIALIAVDVACVLLTEEFRAAWPLSVYLLPLLVAMNIMSFRHLVVLEIATAGCLAISLTMINLTLLRAFGVVVIVLAILIVTLHAYSRNRLGILPVRGDSMLVDLRDRLASQSQLPVLPRAWRAEAVMRSAGGASFSGDFMVAAKTRGGQRLEIVVVDVSGKGLDAGTRSLQLSGAFGGLLGSLPTEAFLPAANEYLMRQEWAEGFTHASGVGRGVRHRGSSRDQPADRRLRTAYGGASASGAVQRRLRPLGRALDVGAGARRRTGRGVLLSPRSVARG